MKPEPVTFAVNIAHVEAGQDNRLAAEKQRQIGGCVSRICPVVQRVRLRRKPVAIHGVNQIDVEKLSGFLHLFRAVFVIIRRPELAFKPRRTLMHMPPFPIAAIKHIGTREQLVCVIDRDHVAALALVGNVLAHGRARRRDDATAPPRRYCLKHAQAYAAVCAVVLKSGSTKPRRETFSVPAAGVVAAVCT